MARVSTYLWLLVFMLVPGAARGQDPLALDQVIRATLANNAALRAARAGQSAADRDARAAGAGFLPRISVTETWQRGDQPVFVFSSLLASRRFAAANFAVDTLNHPSAVGFFQTRLAVEQMVFDGGRLRASVATARLQRTAAMLLVSESAARLTMTAVETYGRLVALEADERAAHAGLLTAEEDLARATRRRDAGLATEADVLSLAVHVADLQERAIGAGGQAATIRAELNRLMGAPIDRTFRTIEPAIAPSAIDTGTRDALLSRADVERSEIKRAAAAVEIAGQQRRAARSAFIPIVAAQAAIDVSGTSIGSRASSWLAGAEVRWTLSTGGAELARRKAAADRESQARAEYDDVRSAVHVEVVSAIAARDQARAREAAGRAAVTQARESQRIIRDRYDAGLAPVNDVLRASSALVEAEARRAAALVDIVAAEARLRRAIGETP